MTTTVPGNDVFSRIIEGAKHYPELGTGNPHIQTGDMIRERREWKEHQEEVRREYQQNPILYYCCKIRGIVPEYEISFEDEYKAQTEHIEARHEATEKFLEKEFEKYDIKPMNKLKKIVYDAEVWTHEKRERKITRLTKPPEGMTKTQWQKELRKKRRLRREEEKERELDRDFVFHNSPQRMFEKMIGNVECECEAEKMRAGEFCNTCVLISRVRQYMLDLFKDVAEGRSRYI